MTLQYSAAYSGVSPEPTQDYLFDPGTYAMKDPALLTSGYTLEPARLQEYGMLATRLRQDIVQRSEALREADEKGQEGEGQTGRRSGHPSSS